MRHFALSAVGADRPGIVAAVTEVLLRHGCNLEDTSMTILRGHFAMTLVVAAPEPVGAVELEAALAPAAREFELVATVRPISEVVPLSEHGQSCTVSIYGADRPGIVHRVASLLAERSLNIVDLSTRMIGSPEHPVYAMLLDVDAPAGTDAEALRTALEVLAGELGVECTLHANDADIL